MHYAKCSKTQRPVWGQGGGRVRGVKHTLCGKGPAPFSVSKAQQHTFSPKQTLLPYMGEMTSPTVGLLLT